ncbi:MAG: metal ABC transporter permease [Dehalococcoidia bacterium]|nr:metal ABC transporter permease [Dehalococcoidia bacterium]
MIDWLLEPWSLQFMQLALVVGVLTATTAGLVGVWVVLRGLSFMGDALAHGVLPGIAIAIILGHSVHVGAVISALVMVAGITWVRRASRLRDDTGIGLLFVGMLALGVIIISRLRSYTVSLAALLFGDILGVSVNAVALAAVAAAVAIVCSALFYRPFVALAFNPIKAESLGMWPRATHALLLGLIALAIIASFQTVGTLLVFGLLVGPAATMAILPVQSVRAMLIGSVALGAAIVVVGLYASYYLATAAGATIAFLTVATFFTVLSAQALWGRWRRAWRASRRPV